jgi:hypothetical protein
MHLIETSEDVRLANVAGLDVENDETCEECLKPVGDSATKKFKPFVLLLDDEAEWVVCADCAIPVL